MPNLDHAEYNFSSLTRVGVLPFDTLHQCLRRPPKASIDTIKRIMLGNLLNPLGVAYLSHI
jgi:hypothetical protein